MERRRSLNVQCRIDPRDLSVLAEYVIGLGLPGELRISSLIRFLLELTAESLEESRNIHRPETYTEAMERLDALNIPLPQMKYNKPARMDMALDSERQTINEILPRDLSAPVEDAETSGDSAEDAAAALLRKMGHGR